MARNQRLRYLLVGDLARLRWLPVAVPALFGLGFGWPVLLEQLLSDAPQSVVLFLFATPIVLGVLVATGLPAYHGQEIGVGWLLGVALCCGALFLFMQGEYTLSQTERFQAAVGLPLAVTIPLGAVGLGVGYGTKRLMRS